MKLIVTEPLHLSKKVSHILEEFGDVEYGPFIYEELLKSLNNADLLMVRLQYIINKELLDHAPKLEYVLTATTGMDHLDLDELKKRDIKVVSLRNCQQSVQNISSTAEHTWLLILSLFRPVLSASLDVLDGNWERNCFWGKELNDKVLGIIGYGRIGSKIARYGEAFGMKVIAYDIDEEKIQKPACSVPLSELLEKSDAITLHITADEDNRNFLSEKKVKLIKKGSIFINTSRGWLVDNIALSKAIKSNQLGGLAVDVVEDEDSFDSENDPIIQCAKSGYNVIVTPHIGGATIEAIEKAEIAIVNAFKELINDKSINN